jgi:catecholate siderophore receptor
MRAFVKASSRQPQHLLASAIGLAVVSLATPALAAEQGTLQLDKVSVQGEQEAGYKTESVGPTS